MTKYEFLKDEALEIANEIDIAIAFKKDWDAIKIIPPLLRRLNYAIDELEYPTTQESTGCLACVTCGELANEWQGLSDDEIEIIDINVIERLVDDEILEFARAIEAKLKEKNS